MIDFAGFGDVVGMLKALAQHEPEAEASLFLHGLADCDERISHADLVGRSRAVADALRQAQVVGKVAVLLDPGVDFLCAFMGCLQAGATPVAGWVPQDGSGLERLQLLLTGGDVQQAITRRESYRRMGTWAAGHEPMPTLRWWMADALEDAAVVTAGFAAQTPAARFTAPAAPTPASKAQCGAAMAALWRSIGTAQAAERSLVRALGHEPFPLSSAQQVIWFDQMLDPQLPCYNIGMAWQMDGPIDHRVLQQAVQRLADSHESLRLLFSEEDGQARQMVLPRVEVSLPLVDFSASPDAQDQARAYLQSSFSQPFSLQGGLPWSTQLVRVSDVQHFWLQRYHHLVTDGVGISLIVQSVARLYNALLRGEPVDEPPSSYRAFVADDQQYLKSERHALDGRYWGARYDRLPDPVVQRSCTDAEGQLATSLQSHWVLSRETHDRLQAFAAEQGGTFTHLFLAALAAYFAWVTPNEQVVIGLPVHNRHAARHKRTPGMFSSVSPIGVQVDANASFPALIRELVAELRRSYRHQRYPLADINRSIHLASTGRRQLFDVMVSTMYFDGDASFGDVPARVVPMHSGVERTPLLINVRDHHRDGDVVIEFIYNSLAFEQDEIERIPRSLAVMLQAAVEAPELPLGRLPLLAPVERQRLLDAFNATAVAYEDNVLLHEQFEAQVRARPQAPAVRDDVQALSYGELNERANRVAHRLLALGVRPDDRVALCVSRGVGMVVGLLGILKSGACYVPLDPAYPASRLAHMLSDCEPAVVLTEQALVAAVQGVAPEGVPLLVPDGADAALLQTQPGHDPDTRGAHGLNSRHLAYIIYTSGSTGLPKGVQIEHRSVLNFLGAMTALHGVSREDSVLAVTTLSFDIAGLELYLPLVNGARIVLASRETASDAARLQQALEQSGVTLMQATPVTWRMLLDNGWTGRAGLRVLCGGEALSGPLAQRLSGCVAQLWNLYGPTETTVWSTAHCIAPEQAGVQPVESIGRPIANTQIYILDAQGRPVPVGVAGEIHIGGHGVARGYWKRPELTQQRFVADPFSAEAGARLYKTGDLGRWLPDGNIDYLGRNDHQVKVRGFRIELGEIEARLVQCPGVREAVVIAREAGEGAGEATGGDKRLVAYLTAQAGEELAVGALRSELSQSLAEYMVPSAFVVLQSLPLTPNGKIDRQALPAPDADALASQPYEAPVGRLEQSLAQIWQELLGVPRVGRHDNFFELGGHSLLAVRVIVRVRQELGVEISLRSLFNQPELAAFAQSMAQGDAGADPVAKPLARIERADRSGPLPVSYAQQRLWFLDRLDAAAGAAYHMPVALRLSGALNREALQATLDSLVRRHEILRTRFASVDGQTVQLIDGPDTGFRLQEVDLSTLAEPQRTRTVQQLSEQEQRAPFDLAQGPLIRGQLLKLDEQEHILLLTQHHIISDGWSTGIMVREVSALYEAHSQGRADPLATLPPLPIQYADYAVWQRQWLQGEVLQQQSQYWKRELAGAPALLELPTDKPRPAEQSYEGAQWNFEIPQPLTSGLRALAQSQGATLFMTLLAGWSVLLSRLSGQQDIVVGTPVANRQRSEVEGLIGFFVNTLALRVRLDDDPTVQALLQQVKASTLAAYEHQDLPFEQVVEALQPQRSLSHSPLFQNMLSLNNTPVQGALQLSGLRISTLGQQGGSTQFDLSLALTETPEGLSATLSYASALYEPASIERLAGYWLTLLQGVVASPQGRVSALPLLSQDQRQQLLETFNATARAYPQDERIHALFEEQARVQPQATALVFEQQQLSYAELNARANQVAHRLLALGIQPDDRVAICLHRGVEMVVGLLGILKSGAAYVPLDPAYPAARLAYMLQDSEPAAVLTQQSLVQDMRQGVAIGVPVLALDGAEAALLAAQPIHDPDPVQLGLTASHLAYIIYTSGSTGQPKGVMVEHRGVVNRLRWMQEALDLRPDEAVLQKTPFGFDVSVWEFFWPLMIGARLVMARPEGHKDPAYLCAVIRDTRVTTIHFVPSMLQQFLAYEGAASCEGLRRVVCSGEELPAALARQLLSALPGAQLHNLYGPTEASVDVTVWTCARDDDRPFVPIGRPIANTALYVLDPQGQPTPLGVSGELHIAGVQVARGYWNRPELTQQRFVPDPFAARAGARMYKTGDLARWLPDGSIDYLGRNDHQVKIRGFRIELGEIEARLAQCPGVREAVVIARPGPLEDRRLVAYLTAHAGQPLEVAPLRDHLRSALPDYMVPSAFVVMEALPLTPNGKLDRQALPAPDQASLTTQAFEAPADAVESTIARIWQDLLGVPRVGRHDRFFELGGHSLLAVQMASRLRAELQVDVPLRQLFEHEALKDLAVVVAAAGVTPQSRLVPVDRSQDLVLSLAQQRLWFLDQFDVAASMAYHMLGSWRINGPLDRSVLKRTLDALVDRHEILRTCFPAVDGRPSARIAPTGGGFHWVEHDLDGSLPAEQQGRITEQASHEARTAFNLAQGPLIRGQLLRLSASDHVLLVTQHHIISDGWSLRLLMTEVSALYDAFSRGAADPLTPPEIQYVDYAAWQRAWLQEDVQQRQIAYWKDRLEGAPALLELPTDRPRPAVQSHAGGAYHLTLDEELTRGLKRLAARHGATLFMTLLAGWAALMSRLSGQEEVVVGMPVANRRRSDLESLIGFFVNTLALRVHADAGATVSGLLSEVRRQTLEAYAHQDVPFEQVVEAVRPVRSLGHHPIFQAMLALDNVPGNPELQLGGLDVDWLAQSQTTARCDLCLLLSEQGGHLSGVLEYASDLFDPATIERLADRYRRLLRAMVADDAALIGNLSLWLDDERDQVLVGFNDTTRPYPGDQLIHQLFEEQVRRTPQAVAVVSGDQQLSYAALNEQANRLAHHLRGMGVGPDGRVAVCMERTPDAVIAFLAVLKAGAAYVPLDPSYPPQRLAYMLSDSAPQVLLTQDSLRDVVQAAEVPVVLLDVAHRDGLFLPLPAGNPDNAEVGCTPGHLAYVIYTSGSTGQPKGVMVDHRGVVRLVRGTDYITLGADDVVAQASNISFDAATFEIWGALLNGARLLLVDKWTAVDSKRLAAEIRTQGISVLFLTTALFNQIAREAADTFQPLRCLLFGGEKVEPRWVEKVCREGRPRELLHVYGPTETVTFASWHAVGPSVVGGGVPIGRPIANTQIYILDAQGRPVPVGVAGEIHIGGHGVARGYWKRPELTQQRFVADPFSAEAGARLYKTGDLGRWLPDGNIDYLGRNDHQVKVRGFRIELGEIEARLVQCPGVREAVVIAREAGEGAGEATGGDKRLVAYLTAQAGHELAVSALRSELAQSLAEYMVPSAFVVLQSLPLTPNGKIDRQALPAPDADALASQPYEAPVGRLEQALAQIWQELLGVPRVGRHDNFFELGGHSLLAVRVIVRVRQELGVETSLRSLFNQPELAAFAQSVAQAGADAGVDTDADTGAKLPARIERADRSGPLPVSYAQQRLWFLDRLDAAAGAAYHMPVALKLSGALNREALQATLDGLVRRHEILRTRFASVDGQTVQLIDGPDTGFRLQEVDLSTLAEPQRTRTVQQLSEQEQRAPFDLAQGPLIRGQLLKLDEHEHILLLTQHHIISDGWSTGIMVREVSALYEAHSQGSEETLPPLPIQYADYAVWQRQWLQGEVLQQQSQYWKRELAGAPALLELPTDKPRPAEQSYEGAQWNFEIPQALTSGLRALAQSQGATLFMTLLAGWSVLLSRLSGQQDIVVGTPVANRQRSEVEGLIGFFVNTLALRVRLDDDPTVQALLQQVKASTLAAYEHQDLPFEQVVEALQPQRSLSHSPLFQNMLSLNNTPVQGALQLSGLRISTLGQQGGSTQFDLSLALTETPEGLSATLSYASALYEPASIERLAGYWLTLLQGVVASPQGRVSALPLLSQDQRQQLLETFNATARAYPQDERIHALFEEQARVRPQATALVFEQEQLSYAELNARANQVAHRLLALGIQPDDRVAICLHRGVEMVVGLLGILKSGAAYVPLDPAYPAARLAYMLQDSEPAAVLTQQSLVQDMRQGVAIGVPVLALDGAEAALLKEQPTHDPDPVRLGLTASHLAYIIYTSGSTGQPKGVMVEHRQVVRLLTATEDWFHFDHRDVWTLFHSFAFDFSVWELWGALAKGGTLVLVPYLTSRSPQAFHELLSTHRVTVLNQTPSAFRQLIAAQAASPLAHQLRVVIFGGEALEPTMLQPWFDREINRDTRLVNMYGITETTVHVTYQPLTPSMAGERGHSPIGRAIPDLRIYVLDETGNPAPIGVTGEMYVGGDGVARGYLNRDDLTQQRFLSDPFSGQAGARMYRTGDLARWRDDGSLEYLGRNDHQVKIRGFRIELGEIEARLASCEGVRDAVVLPRDDEAGQKRLVAYLTAHPGHELSAAQLRSHLSTMLADYMVPSAFVVLAALPLTSNGKLDRQALPAPDTAALATHDYVAPATPTEALLCETWCEVLGLARVGVNDNFFDVGGDSIRSIAIVAKARDRGLTLAIVDLFKSPTIRGLAQALASSGTAASVDESQVQLSDADRQLLPAHVEDAYPVTLLQMGMVFHNAHDEAAGLYHDVTSHQLTLTAWDPAAMQAVLAAMVRRHPALRTAFDLHRYSEPMQVVHADASLPLQVFDIQHLDADAQNRQIAAFMQQEHQTRFALEAPPLLRVFVHLRSADSIQITLSFHHAILDGWSLAALQTGLVNAYAALISGEAADAAQAPLAVTPRHTIAQERQALRSEAHRAFWAGYLADCEFAALPPAEPEVDPEAPRNEAVELSEGVCAQLRALASDLGVPMRSLLLAAHLRMVATLSGAEDVTTGLVANVRPEVTHGDQVLGLFLNTLPFRQKLLDMSWKALIRQTHDNEIGVMAYRHYPYFQLYVDHHRKPFYETTFNYINFHVYEGLHADIKAEGFRGDIELTNNALAVDCFQRPNQGIGIKIDARSLSASQERRALGYFVAILEAMARDPEASHAGQSFLSDAERHDLLERFNATPSVPAVHPLIHRGFEVRAATYPDDVAVIHEGLALTYGQVNASANRLAHQLLQLGVRPDDRVAICMARCPDQLVALLGILKAGAAYVPMDPQHPQDRLNYMLQDCDPAVLIVQQSMRARFEAGATPVITIDPAASVDRFIQASVDPAAGNPQIPELGASHLAYVIYTSGSTGTPKGVLVEHGNAVNLIEAHIRTCELSEADRVLQLASFGFDNSITEIFPTLQVGGQIVMRPAELLVPDREFMAFLARHGVTVADLPTSFWHLWTGEMRLGRSMPWETLRLVIVGGEKAELRHLEAWSAAGAPQSIRWINTYGPTEATVYATIFAWDPDQGLPTSEIPIGHPVENTVVRILDGFGQLSPVGVVGEIHLGGVQVARGYHERPELTQSRFIADPYGDASSRLYRTGDLGRWTSAGLVEYVGRNDFQVKIRGHRIEMGEIEARLAACHAIREAVVLAREEAGGDKRLVAYVTAEEGMTPLSAELRSALLATLPEYMVPVAFVVLPQMPLTPHGKLDRQALPEPGQASVVTQTYEPPQGAIEETIAVIWQDLLDLEQVGRNDHFFELGGHSLMAVSLIEHLRLQGLIVPVRSIFAAPTLAAFARAVAGQEAERTESPALPAGGIEPGCERVTPEMLPLVSLTQSEIDGLVAGVPGGVSNLQDLYPLAPLQAGILFHHMLETTGDPYLLRLVLGFDSRERLDRFLDALQQVIQRHDILRSAFEWEHLSSPVQVVWRQATLPVEALHLTSTDDALGELLTRVDPRQRRLDLRQAPLMAAYIAADTASPSWFLTLLNHHLIGDHVTLDLIVEEVRAILEGRSEDLPEPASYRAFVASALKTDQAAHDAYFGRLLGDVTEPTAPFGLLDVQGSGAGVRETLLGLDGALASRIDGVSRQLGVTPAVLFHVGWALLLSRCTGRDDVVFGTVLLGRMQGASDAQRVLGMFINTLPVRIATGTVSVEEAVRACYAQLTALLVHEQASLGLAQRCSGVKAPMPLFTTLLNYRHIQDAEAAAGGQGSGLAGMVTYAHEERINYPIGVAVNDLGGAYSVSMQCDGVDPEGVARMFVRSVEVLVDALQRDPGQAMTSLDPLPLLEQRRLLNDFNATAVAYDDGALLHEQFEAQVRARPQALAVRDDVQALSYGELNEQANRVAHRLLALGVQPDDRVALCVSRGVGMVVGLLGILKSGACYVPLDPAYPASRLAHMLSDCEPAVVLTEQALVAAVQAVAPEGVPLLVPDGADAALLQTQPGHDPDTRRLHGLHSRHLAYIIYTSGSTGLPKGVQIEHRSVLNFLGAMTALHGVSREDSVLAVTTLSFDIAGLELYLPLVNGARIVLASRETASDAAQLQQALEQSGVTLMQATPVTWRMLLDNGWTGRAGLRVLCGGEALSGPLAQRLSGCVAQLWNLYGPTETTVWSTAHCIAPEQAGVQPVESIGRPIANTQIYILDAQGRPVPVGVAGELHIGGHGVARGYWKRPALTHERFVADPFSAEADARMYRTGDLARWRDDGSLEYLGRNDHQVKIRGFRIELGEIEARLVQCPGVREAVVVAREDVGGDKRLVAYLTAQAGHEQGNGLAVSALRSELSQSLAEYMVPSAFVVLQSLPLTPNGKIDRQALPAPDAQALASQPYEAPTGRLEQSLAQIWQELLGVERVGRHDNFFELGGHSLLAVRVIVRVRQELGVETSLRSLFNQPELAAFAQSVAQAGADTGADPVAKPLARIERADRSGPLPVSYAQQRLWFLDRLDAAAGAAYHMPVALKLSGALNREALQATLDSLVRRHEILRTRFSSVDGQTVQLIDGPDTGFRLQEVDLSTLAEPQRTRTVQQLSEQEQRAPFDLAQGPLIRGQLLKLDEHEHILLLTQHHIISDGWSTGIMVREVSALYEAHSQGSEETLPPLPIQYADYAVWQRQWLQGEVLQQQSQYWKRELAGAPALLELPTDKPRPAEQSYEGAQWNFEIPQALTSGLRALAQSQGATLFMTLLAGWSVLLSRLSGQQDIVVGTPVANRQRSEVEGLIGFFVNTLALRVRLDDDPTVQALLQQVKASTLAAYEHQDLPFEQVVEALQPQRSLSHSPLFQNMLSLNNTPVQGALQLSGLRISTLGQQGGSTQFDLSLALTETPEGLSATLSYASALYEPASIERLAGYWLTLLQGVVASPQGRVSALPLLSQDQRQQLLETFNATARAYPQDERIHALFEEQARVRPQATALVFEQQQLSYAELNARANQVAHRLLALGIQPDDRVAICLHRGVEMVVGLLGILKSGAAYVPLDPAYPAARLAYMLQDSEPAAVLTQQSLVQDMRQGVAIGVPVLALDGAEAALLAAQPIHDPDPVRLGLTASHLAYIIYTSGSTGQPKGVMVEHGGLSSLAHAQIAQFGVTPSSRVLQFVSLSFDVCISEITMTLCSGATLLLAPAGDLLPGEPLLQSLRTLGATHITLPRAALAALPPQADLGAVRTLITGGELLQPQLAATWSAQHALFNSYGPTETTVCATVYECLANDRESIPIGRPVAGKRIYILDEHGAPVPLGTTGEIHIGGSGVARGYWNQPELTRQRFLPDPYGSQPGARLYRTGDLGRWLPDGNVEFLGRNDHQVKVRGFRIELGEIETRLASCQGVREAVVLARDDEGSQKRLVAYVTADPGTELATTQLRSELADLLPDYMVPSAFVVLEDLPLTPNGKVDRQALPALNPASVSERHVAPRTATEAAVSQVWATLLQLDRVGVTDNFFDLGGHSLLIVRLHQELDLMYPGRLAMSDFFTHTTVEQIAAFLGGEQDQDAPAQRGVSRAEARKRSAGQQRDRRSKLGRHPTTGGES